jgi:RNA polymerase sigma-70 factor (ECF subfamily)
MTDDLAAAIETHRRDVVLLCYRFLGSIAEAEEAAQETALKAWRSRAAFRGEASPRTWLHRIATRVCLDLLRQRHGRRLPESLRPTAADPVQPPDPPIAEIAWLEPLPDEFIAGASTDPAARYDLQESVSLAFIAALQVLPPRQRAVLLLRDVLGWSARESADALDQSVSATTSALHRARVALRTSHHRSGISAVPAAAPEDPFARRLLEAYVRAWAADDIDALLATMREDVRLAMPPSPAWYRGRAAVGVLLRRWIFGALRPPGGYATRATKANGQAAFVFGSKDDPERPIGVVVLSVEAAAIVDIIAFLDEGLAARF